MPRLARNDLTDWILDYDNKEKIIKKCAMGEFQIAPTDIQNSNKKQKEEICLGQMSVIIATLDILCQEHNLAIKRNKTTQNLVVKFDSDLTVLWKIIDNLDG